MPDSKLLALVVAVAPLSGCVDPDGAVADPPVGEIASAITVTYNLDDNTPTNNQTYDSGNNSQLSGWEGVLCSAQAGSERLLVELQGVREPSSNADNFIARMRATCREYETDPALHYNVASPSNDETDTVFSEDHRLTDDGATEVEIGGNGVNVPVGIRARFNDTDNYMKDVRLLYRVSGPNGLGSLQLAPYAMGLTGGEHTMQCPTDYALTGVEVRYSTNNGKVRAIRAKCSLLVHR
jgi:hypothetical protein